MGVRLPHDHGENRMEKRFSEKIPETDDFNIVSELFKLLGDSSRLQIFWILCHREECVMDLAAMLDMTSPGISHHLKILKLNGLIESKRTGKEVYYKAVNSERTKVLHVAIEKMVEISCPGREKKSCRADSVCEDEISEQVKTVYRVHKYLIDNLEKRITIESLSKQFLINPTTLKETFKTVFGCSIAAHIKEHRLELAAELLVTTTKSIAEISTAVGYASQSKFSASFYEYYHFSPLEYRKRYAG